MIKLYPPLKDNPISLAYLSQCDGSNEDFPIYVAIKGTVFDVTSNKASYGPGGGYHVFAEKDASRGFGKSSLKEEDAIADYSNLNESELQTLEKWFDFFSKKYNIVGKVVQD
ncbi:hypothetical protein MERGE_002826 [Pneumocystis wakefieldiae]|uniref:Cytochrome b5 heme-binding domain-containing protein n=1 Tax=Pneumocystis wakefieldiae TaxID=38082 RepID=A0A899FY32_9ASCO|nr:hypothetical protein MERGE_002826 [Pneumocystis wakefieldiae]